MNNSFLSLFTAFIFWGGIVSFFLMVYFYRKPKQRGLGKTWDRIQERLDKEAEVIKLKARVAELEYNLQERTRQLDAARQDYEDLFNNTREFHE